VQFLSEGVSKLSTLKPPRVYDLDMSLSPVRLLDPEVVSRIAAGEVVDRPASVLKELLDNAIDAGARSVRVLIVDAGLKRLEVEDDGRGMSPADLRVCTLRHATSKIHNLDDLDAIESLGFRGEALAAVASVAKLQIETFREGEGAWSWSALGSTQGELTPASRSLGTRVRVEDLFFNVPARKKFLRSLSSEFAETRTVLHAVAMTHPEISFEWHFITEKGELKEQAHLEASGLVERLRALQSAEGEILYLDQSDVAPGVRRVQAAFYKAPVSSRFQRDIQLSVNGRPVTDKRLPYALREAYNGLIEVGQYPVGAIALDVDPSQIDVNIHPQKKEIRWPREFNLASMAYGLLRPHFELSRAAVPDSYSAQSLSIFDQSSSAPSPSLGGGGLSSLGDPRRESSPQQQAGDFSSERQSHEPYQPQAKSSAFSSSTRREEAPPTFRFNELRVVGEVGAAWIVCESSQGLVLIDQHAAHERVNFERILRSANLLRSKPLLIPHVQKLPAYFAEAKAELAELLSELGFEISEESLADSASDTLEFIAVPEADRVLAWDDILEDIFRDFRRDSQISHWPAHLRMRLAASLSCHGSVRRGQRLSNEEIRALLVSMDQVEWGGLCPHGRPVWLPLTHHWIEEQFHR
jgi:DNA mismatch repair protein MutL